MNRLILHRVSKAQVHLIVTLQTALLFVEFFHLSQSRRKSKDREDASIKRFS